jgi:hypothetical protein
VETYPDGNATAASKSSRLAFNKGAQRFGDGSCVVWRESDLLIGREGGGIHSFDVSSDMEKVCIQTTAKSFIRDGHRILSRAESDAPLRNHVHLPARVAMGQAPTRLDTRWCSVFVLRNLI